MAKVRMPQLGETVIEGTILKWLKQEGERVEQDEPLFEISTDKVDTEVPSPEAGVVTEILVPEGRTVAVGTDLATIEAAGSAAPSPTPPPGDGGVRAAAGPPRSTRPDVQPERGPRSQILSPIVRRLADEHGIDLARVHGTGTGGRITREDVLAATESGPAPATAAASERPQAAPTLQEVAAEPSPGEEPAARPTAAAAHEGDEVAPMSHLRKTIAQHMVRSSQTAARAWTLVEVNMENVVRLRDRVKERFAEREGFRLTFTPFVTRAATEALLQLPLVNAELEGEQLVVHHEVNMGIAVSIEGGLIVPVVTGADSMNLVGLARAISDLATRARAKQLQPDEVHGATFSITNPGPFGSLISLPIINQPNTAILAFDAVQKRPVVIDDAIAIRHMAYISMSWDHRVIDGALAAQFLAKVKENLETWDWAEDLGL